MAGLSVVLVVFSFLALLVGAVIVGVCIFFAVRNRNRITAIAGAPISTVAELENGYQKVNGRAVALEPPLQSPMSRSKCIFYHFQVEEERTRTVTESAPGYGPGGSYSSFAGTRTRTEHYWETVIDDRQSIGCGVEDRTGLAEVEILDAETVLDPTAHSQSGLFNSTSRSLQQSLMRRYGYSTRGWFFNKGIRYTETIIREGDRLFVIGEVERQTGKPPCFVKGKQPFIVSDRREESVVSHYRTRVMWCWVGAVAAGFLSFLVAAVPVGILLIRQAAPVPVVGPVGPLGPPDFGKPPLPPNRPPPPQIDPALADLRSPDPAVRARGVQAFNQIPRDPARQAEVVAALRAILQDPNPQIRAVALNALQTWDRISEDPYVQAMTDLKSADPLIRARGASLLGLIPIDPTKKDEVVRVLHPLLDDESIHVRFAAESTLTKWDPTGPKKPYAAQDDKGYYKQDLTKEPPEVAVVWTAKPDPPPARALPAPANPRAAIPLNGMHLPHVAYPALPGSFALIAPPVPTGRGLDGLVQVVDLRTLKPVGPAFVARPANGERLVLSPDGQHVAGRVPVGQSNARVEVLSTSTGQSVRVLEAAHDPKEWGHPVEFLGPERLLTMAVHHQFPEPINEAHYKVWDFKTGKLICEFGVHDVFHPKHCGLSPGGRYLVLQQASTVIGQRLLGFDLTSGKIVGDIMLQPKKEKFGQAAGIVFSPDGKEFAMLWRLGERPNRWGQLWVFDAATGQRMASHNIGYGMKNIDSLWGDGGYTCLQWTPDGKGWLLFGHLLMDRKTGAVTGKLGTEPNWHAELQHRRFVGPGHVTAIVKAGVNIGLTYEPVKGAAGPP